MINTFTGPKEAPATIRDVARLAGVSTATVSRVVNDTGDVSGQTRTSVLAAIAKLKYRPNAHAANWDERMVVFQGSVIFMCPFRPSGIRRLISDPGTDTQIERRQTGLFHFQEDEYSRVSRLVTNLSVNQEKLEGIADLC